MYRGRITFSTPMLWFLGFIFSFTIGGVTGVMMAVPAIDFQFHNSLFLVAHFHNQLVEYCRDEYWPAMKSLKMEKFSLFRN